MLSFFCSVLGSLACLSPLDVESIPPDDSSVSVVSEMETDSSVSDDSSEVPLSSVIVENVDEIAAAVAASSAPSLASVPPVSGDALNEFFFFEIDGIRFYVPSNYLDYVKLIDSPPYVLNTSSNSITLWASNDSDDYRLAPMGGLQKRVYSSGYTWQDIFMASKPESNLSSLSRSDFLPLIFVLSLFLVLLLTFSVF